MFNTAIAEPYAQAGEMQKGRGCLIAEVLLKRRLRILDEFPSLGPVLIPDGQLCLLFSGSQAAILHRVPPEPGGPVATLADSRRFPAAHLHLSSPEEMNLFSVGAKAPVTYCCSPVPLTPHSARLPGLSGSQLFTSPRWTRWKEEPFCPLSVLPVNHWDHTPQHRGLRAEVAMHVCTWKSSMKVRGDGQVCSRWPKVAMRTGQTGSETFSPIQ